MPNLRVLAEKDLKHTIEGDWSTPVVLITPEGDRIDCRGLVQYDIVRQDPENQQNKIVVNMPVVVLRRSSLSRVPLAGENWAVVIPVDPTPDAPVATFVFTGTQPPEGGRTIGFIRLYLQQVEQDDELSDSESSPG